MGNPIKQIEGRNVTAACKNCDAYSTPEMECRKHAPVLLPWIIRDQGAYDPVAVAITETYCTEWPKPKPDDWCCEWLAETPA